MRSLFFTAALCLAALSAGAAQQNRPCTQFVDPYIGTGGHGHVFLGANVPFGAVQLGPTSIPQDWDWTSGYHISDTTVIGFSHTHLSGTGCADLCEINLMPVVGQVKPGRGVAADPASGTWSYFSRANERVRPGYYATRLDRYGVDVELTATQRVGFHKYTFPAGSDARVIIDLVSGNCDQVAGAFLTKLDGRTVAGYRISNGWAKGQRVYFVAQFSEPFTALTGNGEPVDGDGVQAVRLYGELRFDPAPGKPLYVKVAISPVSIDNALLNLQTELPGWDFEATVAAAERAWEEELSKIDFRSSAPGVMRTFYTALYHTMVAPSVFCDVNGDYRGADGQIYRNAGFTNYTTFSLWDTYRAAHPLMTLIHPEKMADMMQTMLHICDQQGKLPVWHLMGWETHCMVGNPGVCVVADAVTKGFGGFDPRKALDAMRRSAMLDERGMKYLKQYGYIPYDLYNESVATCMEYALADWAIAQAALKLGAQGDYKFFLDRSLSYRRYFDPATGFMRGLSSEGKLREPFNPFESVHRQNDYTEGNAWQYTWLAPHDVEGLINLFGSRERFLQKLDSLFVVQGDMGKHASPDISGLIGQYAHGNEPSHHIIYLYTMAGQPWKTAEKVREVLTTLYHDRPDGLSGNEDVGQMSAWYVLSSLGFYQVEPAGGRYFFGSPLMDKAVMKVRGGMFTVVAHDNSPENIYIRKIMLNGKPYKKNYIAFDDIAAGGTLEFFMGDRPGVVWY